YRVRPGERLLPTPCAATQPLTLPVAAHADSSYLIFEHDAGDSRLVCARAPRRIVHQGRGTATPVFDSDSYDGNGSPRIGTEIVRLFIIRAYVYTIACATRHRVTAHAVRRALLDVGIGRPIALSILRERADNLDKEDRIAWRDIADTARVEIDGDELAVAGQAESFRPRVAIIRLCYYLERRPHASVWRGRIVRRLGVSFKLYGVSNSHLQSAGHASRTGHIL